MGAAGDMLSAALAELLPDPEGFIRELNGIGIPGVSFCLEETVKNGIRGSHMRVLVNGEEEGAHHHSEHSEAHRHSHSSLHGIGEIVQSRYDSYTVMLQEAMSRKVY